MSFASMHNDYLDPDKSGLFNEDWELDCDLVRHKLKDWDTGRWDWERIDCCLTGKNADLDPWGCQGLEVSRCDEDHVTVIAHAYKTFAGTDVCLNIGEVSDDEYDKCLDAFLDQAQEVMCGCDSAGEWDGDSWIMTFEETLQVSWVIGVDGVVNYAATAEEIVKAVQAAIKPWEDEMVLADDIMNQLAGWRDENNDSVEEGHTPSCAAWAAVDTLKGE